MTHVIVAVGKGLSEHTHVEVRGQLPRTVLSFHLCYLYLHLDIELRLQVHVAITSTH